ncbi:ADP-ribosylglycohydrolase family protein [uncultured Duncaniella sp.]|uniref:ADP-ribosylglycohydrolase family protein n=1 Tax=uncultured Duncaniella sp. TaxID=2768039 RepID=UPI0025B683F9|nr:ADP-ribosylglycohydrolase family protein [uncultured Duncaniella sp.]
MNTENIKDKMLGCLWGQAIGDALGLGSEFMSKNEVIKHYSGGLKTYSQIVQDAHRCRWEKGAWTDDTDMMLCILSGFDNSKFNLRQVASNFKDWFNGKPMGIGSHTFKVLCMGDYVELPEMCSKLWWNLSRQQSAANGALMRTSVVGLLPNNIEEQAEAICKLTHYDPRCIGSCVIASSIIHNIVWHNKQLSKDEIKEIGARYDDRISEWIEVAYNSTDISLLDLDETHSIGYTLRTLSAALWCYWHSPSFDAGLLSVVNEGGDADTNGAIACAILGAKFGFSSIPDYYIFNLHNHEEYRNKIMHFIDQVINEQR